LPVAVSAPLTFEKTILLKLPVNVPPVAIVPVTGAVTGAAVADPALVVAANAVCVMATIVIMANAVARIGSRSFIASSFS
jgi:hypothetical protein